MAFTYKVGELKKWLDFLITPEIKKVLVGIDDDMNATADLVYHRDVGLIPATSFNPFSTSINWEDEDSIATIGGITGSSISVGCFRLVFDDGTYMDVPFSNDENY